MQVLFDYRALNKVTGKSWCPVPRADGVFHKLHRAQYFTILDAAYGFHQTLLKPEDISKTASRTPFGSYQFKALPFGLTNVPAETQTAVNKLFDQACFDANGAASLLVGLSAGVHGGHTDLQQDC